MKPYGICLPLTRELFLAESNGDPASSGESFTSPLNNSDWGVLCLMSYQKLLFMTYL